MEKRFTLRKHGYHIPCRLELPDYSDAARLVLSVHGFCGSKEDPVQSALAEEMSLFGYATVRFDFPAHGDNLMTDRDLTLDNCVTTLLTVAQWAQETFPEATKCMFATGFGAFITVQALEKLCKTLGHIRLVLQTPDFQMAKTLLRMRRITAAELQQAGSMTIGRPGDRLIQVSYRFYEELHKTVSFVDCEMPMLLIRGECDEFLDAQDVSHFRRLNEQARLVEIPGADHQFSTEGAWDMVMDLTRDWFECEQVLLCDCE